VPAAATGIGSMPGTDIREAQRIVVGELPEFVHLVETPALGPPAEMVGRATAIITGLGFDLQPAGWRLTDAPGIDHRRARSVLEQQLDVLEELTQGYTSRLKIQVAGPWTLAATLERPRGDRVLADHGARREVAQALADGVRSSVDDLRRRIPGADVTVQVDEPALPAVLAAGVPTASGFGRHRRVDEPTAAAALTWVFEAVRAADATPILHCCAADVPVALVTGAGAAGVSVDAGLVTRGSYDAVSALLAAGHEWWLGVVPANPADSESEPDVRAAVDHVIRLLDELDFAPEETLDRIVVTPSCGLGGSTAAWARTALARCGAAARALSGEQTEV
jgi:methionine synthase II (cobalamin-independent)